MSRKFIQITFSILLLGGMILGFAIKDGVLAQDNPTAKFESGLADKLTAGPTDFFVVMAEQADVSAAKQLQTKAEKGQYVFDTLVATANRTQADLRSYLDSQGATYDTYYIVNSILVKGGNLDLANSIAARPDVSALQLNHGYQLDEPKIDPSAPNNPNLVENNIAFVKADQVWALGVTGAGSVVASNDTGLYWNHPALIRQYRGCQNPPDCTVVDHNFNWWDATGTFPTIPNDDHGHGTHTSGTMVGDDGVGNQVGMAPGARLVACKNMDSGGFGQDQWFLTCFEWDLAPWDLSHNNPTPALAPDAINNSWGYGGGGVNTFRTAVDNLLAAGIVVEVSAGNEGSGCQTLRSPGDYAEVFTTGSVNHYTDHILPLPGTLTGFSSRGPSRLDPGYFPDFMAPGENIRSSVPGGGYQGGWSGTSMAGPHVTALIGLIWSANPALEGQIDTTYQIIQQTVVPLTGQHGSDCGGDYTVGPNNDWGYGTIDALAAVQMAITMGGAGNLDGNVADAVTGNPIVGANVFALKEGGFGKNAQTDDTGYYTMTVASGTYAVTASDPRYESVTIEGVKVITDMLTTQNFELTQRGKLTGKVTDFDNGFPLVGATLTADTGTTATTDASGDYTMFLDTGTHEVTATMKDYTSLKQLVDMFSGETTVKDYALQAAVVFTPSPLHVTVDLESTLITDTSILNRQAVDYAFKFAEKDEGYIPALKGAGKLNSVTELAGSPFVPEGSSSSKAIQPLTVRTNAAEILVLSSTDVTGSINKVLTELALPFDYLTKYGGDIGGTDFTPYKFVILGMDGGAFTTGDMQYLRENVIDADKRLIFMGGTCWADFAMGVNQYLVANNTGNYCWQVAAPPSWTLTDAAHGLAEGLPDSQNFVNFGAGYYSIRVTDPSAEVVGVNGDGWPMYFYKGDYGVGDFVWMIDSAASYYWSDPSDYAFFKQTLTNALTYGGGNVPWFGEVPNAGTVPAGEVLPVSVYFTATHEVGINQPGDYLGTLSIIGTPKVKVPVVMTVPVPETWGKVEGAVTDSCTGEPLVQATLTITDGVPITQTFTNEAGLYSFWEEAGSYEAIFSAAGFVDKPVTLVITPGQTTVLDAPLRPDAGCLTVDPTSMDVTLAMNAQTTLPLTLGNVGGAALNYDIRERDRGFTPAIDKQAPATNRLPAVANPGSASILNRPSVPGTAQFEPVRPNVWLGATSYPMTIARYGKAQCPGDVNSFYIIGGVSGGTIVNALNRYDATTDTWTSLAAASSNIQENPTAVCFDGKIYATGGGYITDFYIYDIATNTWTNGPSMSRAVEGGAMAGYNGKIYVIGGDDNFYPADGVSDQVNVYDIETNAWVANASPMPQGIENGATIQLGQYVYIVGGWWQSSPGSNSNLTLRYDIETDTWETGPVFAPARADFAVSATVSNLYVMGGDTDGGGYWDSSNVVWKYDFNAWPSGNWEDVGDNLPFIVQAQNAGFATDALTGGEIWTIGGLEGPSFTWHADALYRAAEAPWSPIPPNVLWVSEEPVSGTIAVDGTELVNVTFDSSVVNQPGAYKADLNVHTDSRYGSGKVALTMNVNAPATWGKLTGVVSDSCTGALLEKVAISIEGGDPITQTQTDKLGAYAVWLEQGSYPLKFSLENYLDSEGIADILPGEVTTIDVQLVPNRPCIKVAPNKIEAWVLTDIPEYQTEGITLTNPGGQNLSFEIREKDGGSKPAGGYTMLPSIPANVTPGLAPAGSVPTPSLAGSNPVGSWENRASTPFATMDNPYVEYDGKGYLVGGYGANGSVGIFDPNTNSWTTGAVEPSPQIAYAVDGCVGLNGSGQGVVVLFNDTTSGASTLHRYNIDLNSWDTPAVPSGFPSNGLWAHNDVSMLTATGENVCYITGGASVPGGGDTSALYAYHPDTNTVENLGNFNYSTPGFDFHAAWYVPFVGASGAVCVGGGMSSANQATASTQCYDLATGVFNTKDADLGQMPSGLWGMASGFLVENGNYELWVANGADAGFALWPNSAYFNETNGSWAMGPTPPTTVYRVGGTNITADDGCSFYVGAGSTGGFTPSTGHNRNFSSECPVKGKADVEWVWEEPVSGTVTAGGVENIGVFFTSNYTTGLPMPLGIYTATLRILNDDPVAGTRNVTVVMHIVNEYLAPVPDFTAEAVGVGNPTVFVNTSDPGVPPTKLYAWDFGDGTTLDVGTKDPVSHTYATFGTFKVMLTTCNVVSCETVIHNVVVLPKPFFLPLMHKN